MMLPFFERLSVLPPEPRFLFYELFAHGGDLAPGVFQDGVGLLASRIGCSREKVEAKLITTAGWIRHENGLIFAPEVMSARCSTMKISSDEVVEWNTHLLSLVPSELQVEILFAFQAWLTQHASATLARKWRVYGSQARGVIKPPQAVPVQEILALYHEILPMLPRVVSLSPQRQSFVRQRWLDLAKPEFGGIPPEDRLAYFQAFFERVHRSDFLIGATNIGFRADFEWLMRPQNFLKVIEGRYDPKPHHSKVAPPVQPQYSKPFVKFMESYPNPCRLPQAWEIWQTLKLDDRLCELIAQVNDDRHNPSYRRGFPWPDTYLKDQIWLTSTC